VIKHVVTWTLLESDTAKKAEAAAFVITQLTTLPALIPAITSLSVWSNAVSIVGNGDLVLIGEFADEAALRAYIDHPEHQKVVTLIKPYFAQRSAVNFFV